MSDHLSSHQIDLLCQDLDIDRQALEGPDLNACLRSLLDRVEAGQQFPALVMRLARQDLKHVYQAAEREGVVAVVVQYLQAEALATETPDHAADDARARVQARFAPDVVQFTPEERDAFLMLLAGALGLARADVRVLAQARDPLRMVLDLPVDAAQTLQTAITGETAPDALAALCEAAQLTEVRAFAPGPPVPDYIEREDYADVYRRVMRADSGEWVLALVGPPGTGKSAFMQTRRYGAQQRGVLLAYLDLRYTRYTIGNIAQALLDQLGANLGLRAYLKAQALIETRGTMLSEFVPHTTATTPAAEGALAPPDTPLDTGERPLHYDDPAAESDADREADRPGETIWDQAAEDFARDFAATFSELAREPVHLYFDTLEVREAAAKQWLLNNLLPALRDVLPHLRVIVAGQRTFETEAGDAPTVPPEQRTQVSVRPFAQDEAAQYLRTAGGMTDPDEIAAVLLISGGLPILLSMVARVRALSGVPVIDMQTAAALRDAPEADQRRALYEHLIAHLRPVAPGVVEMLQMGAPLRHFDRALMGVAVERELSDAEWRDLRTWPFIQEAAFEDEDTAHAYSLHEVIRDIQRVLAREQLGADGIARIHQRAALYITGEVRRYAPERRAVQIEQIVLDGLYHYCHAHDPAALRVFLLDQFAEAVESASDENLDFCSTMLDMVRREYADMPPELHDLLAMLQAGRDGIAARQFENALPLLETLIAHPTVRPALLPAIKRATATLLHRYSDDIARARALLNDLIAENPDDSKTLFTLARLEAEAGNYTAASDTLHDLIGFGGTDAVHAHIELARVYMRMHQKTSTEVALSSALSFAAQILDTGERAAAFESVGSTFVQTLDAPENAIVAYQQALEAQPDRESTVLKLVEVYQRLKRWEDVSEAYRQLAAISPDESRPRYLSQAALAVMHTGKIDEAEAELLRLTRDHPLALEGFSGLAAFYEHEERWQDARETHQRIADRFANWRAIAQVKAMVCLHKMGRTEEAEAELAQLRADSPDNRDIAAGAALLYRQLERWNDMIAALRTVIDLSEEARQRARTLETIGDIYRDHLDDLAGAEDAYRAALEAHPGHHSALAGLVRVYEQREDWDQARETHQRIARVYPQHRIVAESKAALCLSRAGQVEQAETELQTLRATYPYDVQVLLALATFFEEQDRPLDAIAVHEDIASLDEDRAVEALMQVEQLYRAQGMEAEADDALRDAEERAEQLRESGQQLLKMAVRQHQMGNLEQAIQLLHKAAERDPDSLHPIYTNLGMIYMQQRRHDDAQSMFDKAIEIDAERVEPYIGSAQLLESQQRWLEAIDAHKRVAEIDDTHAPAAWEHAGNIYRDHLADLEQAEACYHTALELDPQRASAYVGLANAYETFKRWTEAAETHRKVGEVEPDYAHIARAKAALCIAQAGQLDEAEAELGDLRAQYPNDVQIAIALSQFYESQSRYADAIEMQRTVVELDPEQAANAYMKIGAFYKELGRDEEARAAFQQAEQAAGDLRASGKQLLQLAVIQQRMGNLDESEALLNKTLARDPESQHAAYTNLGALYTRRRQFDKAQAMFAKAIELDPTRAEPYIGMAQMLEQQQRWDEAIDTFRQIAELRADFRAAAWEQIGAIYRRQLKNYEKAEDAIKQALAAEPHRANAQIELAYVYEDAERWEDAATAHRRVGEMARNLRPVAQAKAAICIGKGGRPEIAEAELQTLRLENPDNVHIVLALAQFYEHEDRLDDAIAMQEQAAALSADHAMEAYLKVGDLHKRAGRDEEAQGAFDRAESVAQEVRESSNRVMQLAVMQLRMGHEAEAEKLLLAAAESDPDNRHAAYTNLGSLYTQQKRYAEAEQMYSRAIDLDPTRPEAFIGMAALYERQERWQDAIAVYEHIAEQFPEHQGAAWEKIGDINRDALEDTPAAEAAYRQALALEPHRASAQIGLAYAYERADRWDDAADAHLIVGQMATQYQVAARAKSAMCRSRAGHSAQAEAELAQLRHDNPDNLQILLALVQIYDFERRWDELDALVEEIRTAEPDNRQVQVMVANHYESMGRWEAAVEAHRLVADTVAEHRPAALSKIGVGLAKLGRIEAARAVLEQLEDEFGDDDNVLIQIARLREMLDADDSGALATYDRLEPLLRAQLEDDDHGDLPEDTIHRRMGWLFYKTGRLAGAVEMCERVDRRHDTIDARRSRVILAAIAHLEGNAERVNTLLDDLHLKADLIWEGTHDIAVVARRTGSTADLDAFNARLEATF